MTHEMKHFLDASGNDCFLCPICDRRIIVDFDNGGIMVIVQGDEVELHSAGIGGLEISCMGVMDQAMYDFWDEEISKLKGEL